MQNSSIIEAQVFTNLKIHSSPCLTCDSDNVEQKNPQFSQTQGSWRLTYTKSYDSQSIQEEIMNWFSSKNIQFGNPQDIVDCHRENQREQVYTKLKLEKNRSANFMQKSASNVSNKRLVRALSIVF